jgi:hypothetical protein
MFGEVVIVPFLDPGLRRDDVSRASSFNTITPSQIAIHPRTANLFIVIPAQAGIHPVLLNTPQVVTQ